MVTLSTCALMWEGHLSVWDSEVQREAAILLPALQFLQPCEMGGGASRPKASGSRRHIMKRPVSIWLAAAEGQRGDGREGRLEAGPSAWLASCDRRGGSREGRPGGRGEPRRVAGNGVRREG